MSGQLTDIYCMKMNVKGRRILVVDDQKANCSLLTEGLTLEGFTVREAYSGKDAITICQEWQPHLVLLDHDMPGMTGLETVRIFRKNDLDVDVMFVSANGSPNLIADALDAGADDYVQKPYSFRELTSRIMVRFRIRDLREELQVANAKLLELSLHDDLTGLFNMRNIYKKIEIELKRARRASSSVSCLMIDMDHFKSVNDGHDHLFGSFVLKEMGAIIKKSIREADFAARYGGDEFLIVLTEANAEGTRIFAERLRETVKNHTFKDGSDEIKLTLSIGFAVSTHDGEPLPRDLVRVADHALYEAKDSGRNRVRGYNSDDVISRLHQIQLDKKTA
jgi:two-component system cell cycle response regulator